MHGKIYIVILSAREYSLRLNLTISRVSIQRRDNLTDNRRTINILRHARDLFALLRNIASGMSCRLQKLSDERKETIRTLFHVNNFRDTFAITSSGCRAFRKKLDVNYSKLKYRVSKCTVVYLQT